LIPPLVVVANLRVVTEAPEESASRMAAVAVTLIGGWPIAINVFIGF
jgi:hypothetical protein